MMDMKELKRRRDIYLIIVLLGFILTIYSRQNHARATTIFTGLSTLIFLPLFIRQIGLIRDISIIRDNPILVVATAATRSRGNGKKEYIEEIIISTFGILLDKKIYKWGSGGVHGILLKSIDIDSRRIKLVFGRDSRNTEIEIIHDLESRERAISIGESLWKETGVMANIHGWED